MDETTNNTFKKSNLIILLVLLVVLVGGFFFVKYYFNNKPVVGGEQVYVSDPEMAEENARLKAEQETVLFEEKDKAPTGYLLGLPVETNPVDIELSKAVTNFAGTEREVTFVNYVYYSILSRNQIVGSFKDFFSREDYLLEEVNESKYDFLSASKENDRFSITVSSIDGGLSYVTISLTIK